MSPARDLSNFISAASILRLCKAVTVQFFTHIKMKLKLVCLNVINIRGVTGGTGQTSGGCSLCYTIPI